MRVRKLQDMRTFVPDSGWDTPIVLAGRRAATRGILGDATNGATRDATNGATRDATRGATRDATRGATNGATRPDPAGEVGPMHRLTATGPMQIGRASCRE